MTAPQELEVEILRLHYGEHWSIGRRRRSAATATLGSDGDARTADVSSALGGDAATRCGHTDLGAGFRAFASPPPRYPAQISALLLPTVGGGNALELGAAAGGGSALELGSVGGGSTLELGAAVGGDSMLEFGAAASAPEVVTGNPGSGDRGGGGARPGGGGGGARGRRWSRARARRGGGELASSLKVGRP